MFLLGEKSSIQYVFDKSRNAYFVTEGSKVNLVEVTVAVQSLVQRVTDLEDVLSSRNKIIDSLSSELKTLPMQYFQRKSDHECMKAETTSRSAKYDSFQKLRNENSKRGESDYINFEKYKTKTNDKLNRLSKVTSQIEHTNDRESAEGPNGKHDNESDRNSSTITNVDSIVAEKIHSLQFTC